MAVSPVPIRDGRYIVGSDYRSLRTLDKSDGYFIVIDMTVEQRNKLPDLEPWQYINIPTLDFQCPTWTAEQWLKLAAFVWNEGECKNDEVVVLAACQGGQGRTGIALAILRAIITEDFAAPVKAIRKFNPHFIETPGQEAYVKRIVKELDEMTKPVPVIEPIDWPTRAGKAEKRVEELETKIEQMALDYLKALNCIASVQEAVHPWTTITDRDF